MNDIESLRMVLLKVADLAWIDNHTEDEVRYLSQAVTLKPNDFVGNFRLGIALEHRGKKEDTVNSYEASLADPSLSGNLKKFISYHLGYLKSKGCRKRQENAGLRYTVY